MDAVLEEVRSRAEAARGEEGVYRDAAGRLRCAVCHEPREEEIPGIRGLCPVVCSCLRREEERREMRSRAAEARRRAAASPFWSPGCEAMTFGLDDAPDSGASLLCREYVRRWEDMQREDLGLIFSGPLGTGKSFYAAAIVNALLDRGVPAVMTAASRLVNLLRAAREPQAMLDELCAFPLVALDDLGAERDTDFAVEVLESFVDLRAMSKKPLLVTTNLTGKQLRRPPDLRYGRIFDRVLALCPCPVLLTGPSRRVSLGEQRRSRMEELLGKAERPG